MACVRWRFSGDVGEKLDTLFTVSNLAELDSARMKIQAYVARELPMIALAWRDASYPIRSEG